MAGWNGTEPNKERVVLLVADRGAGLESLVRKSVEEKRSYQIVGALTTSPNSQAIPVLERWGIPWRCHDIHDFYRSHGAKVSDLALRPDFDRRSLELIAEFQPSILALYGYIYVLSRVALKAYPWRIINIHDSDLTIMNGDGRPKYRGLHSTREAIIAGEPYTRSTAHIATDEVDAGPILVRSRPYPVHIKLVGQAREMEAMDLLKVYAYAHREWMIRDAWGSLMDTALELLAQERVSIRAGRALIDGRPEPFTADINELVTGIGTPGHLPAARLSWRGGKSRRSRPPSALRIASATPRNDTLQRTGHLRAEDKSDPSRSEVTRS